MTRWNRFGQFPASAAVVALFGGDAVIAGLLHARETAMAVIQLLFLGAFLAYCCARPRGGALLALPVVVGSVLLSVLTVDGDNGVAIPVAIATFVASFVVANKLAQREDATPAARRDLR